jgi:hypothetical protein
MKFRGFERDDSVRKLCDPPCIELHDNESVDHGEERGALRHEVACADLVVVILERCLSALPSAWGGASHRGLSSRIGRVLDAELEIEF